MRKSLLFSAALGFLLLPELHAETWVKVASRDLLKETSRHGMQQNIVQGTVSDKDGPIAGASVSIVGTSKSTMTDLNGHFKIEATKGQTLRVSFLGYKPTDIVVTSSQMNI